MDASFKNKINNMHLENRIGCFSFHDTVANQYDPQFA